jgi:hypothetical protein
MTSDSPRPPYDYPRDKVLPLVRTRDEAMLYMELHPCEICGNSAGDWKNALVMSEGEFARRYWDTCSGCGQHREFIFLLPENPTLPPPNRRVVFGGAEHSRLIDAGEWLWLADMCARAAVPESVGEESVGEESVGEGGQPRLDAEARESLEIAIVAIGEVLKFIPRGADRVPPEGFWTARGEAMLRHEAGRFERSRLEVVRDSYLDALIPPSG